MATERTKVTVATAAVVVGMAGLAFLATVASPVAADQHTRAEADDYTEEANYTVDFPNPRDHYPGDENEENGSVQYWAAGEEAMREAGAEEGAFVDSVVVDADWIDYSACDVDNTAVFGFDRGNDNPGTGIDEDLVQYQKRAEFREDGLTVEFYDWNDLANDPPYGAPEDAIVAQQGDGSNGGPCLTPTDEPGWYQMQGFVNGTEADNGPDERPSEDAASVGILARSNYLYVCECDSEAEAREELGPPPNEDGEESEDGTTPTPTATSTPTETGSDDGVEEGETRTPTPTATATATPTESRPETTADAGQAGNDGPGVRATPTPGDGPGFGPLAALLALLTVGLPARRR